MENNTQEAFRSENLNTPSSGEVNICPKVDEVPNKQKRLRETTKNATGDASLKEKPITEEHMLKMECVTKMKGKIT